MCRYALFSLARSHFKAIGGKIYPIKELDESILAACPTEEIESEIVESEELTDKIT